jgi:type I restriction enzyme S subunit
MSNEAWTEEELGSLIDVKHGFAFKGEFFTTKPPGDILLTPGNFAIGGGFKYDKLKFYDGPVPDEYILDEGDLLVTMTDLSKAADTLGFPALVPQRVENGPRYLHNQRLGLVTVKDPDKLRKRFLYYLMCGRRYRAEIVAGATGTTVKHTSPTKIKQFKALIPPPAQQDAIAETLGSLDEKIALNRRLSRALDKMAWALFKAWFIDFDPVRTKAEGATSFPGMPNVVFDQLANSLESTELGEVPQGWPRQTVADIAEYVNGRAFTKHANGKGRMIIRIAELNTGPGSATKYSDMETESQYTAFPDDVLFAWSGSLDVYRWHRDEAIINQHIFKVVPAGYPKWYVHYRLVEAMPFFQTIAANKATTMGHIKRGHLSDALFADPPACLIEAAENHIQPLYDLVHCTERESLALASIRDALLPKLLEGEFSFEGLSND